CPTDELHNRRGCCHRERSNTRCLRDGAITDIRVSIFLRITTKIESLDFLRWTHIPAIAQPTYSNTKVGTIARHGSNHAAERNTMSCQCYSFTCSHREVQIKEVIAVDIAQ